MATYRKWGGKEIKKEYGGNYWKVEAIVPGRHSSEAQKMEKKLSDTHHIFYRPTNVPFMYEMLTRKKR